MRWRRRPEPSVLESKGSSLFCMNPLEEKKWRWQDIIDEPDEENARRMVCEPGTRSYTTKYPTLEKAISRKKQ